MSVLLKDFDMPTSCYNRETRTHCPLLDTDCYCSIRCRHFEFHYDDRPTWCPLVEISTPYYDLGDEALLAMRNAEASLRMEGLEVTQEMRDLCAQVLQGNLSVQDYLLHFAKQSE